MYKDVSEQQLPVSNFQWFLLMSLSELFLSPVSLILTLHMYMPSSAISNYFNGNSYIIHFATQ